ncbi:MAG: hypothetical protein H0T62_00655 [Parachlamydiaceae bacterium]|nr:hypothetical protein [Parachlamydiaceae bacterium]
MQQLQPSFINSIVNTYNDYENFLAKVGSKIDINNENADIYSGVGIGIDVAGGVGIGVGTVLLLNPFTFIPGVAAIALGALSLAGGSTIIHTAKIKKTKIEVSSPISTSVDREVAVWTQLNPLGSLDSNEYAIISEEDSDNDTSILPKSSSFYVNQKLPIEIKNQDNRLDQLSSVSESSSSEEVYSLQSTEDEIHLTNSKFPVKSLKHLFKFAERIELKNILDNALMGKTIEMSSDSVKGKMAKAILDQLQKSDTTGLLAFLLTSNFSYNKIFHILYEILSNDFFANIGNLIGGLYDYVNGISLTARILEIPEIANLMKVFSKIEKHIKMFQLSETKVDLEALCISLLKDRPLMEFLQEPYINLPLIVRMCAVFQIPNLDIHNAEMTIRSFIRLQKAIINTRGNEKITKYKDISDLFFDSDNHEFEEISLDLTRLLFRHKNIIKVYLQPLLLPIHLVAKPIIEQLFLDIHSPNPLIEGKIKNNCKILFKAYRDEVLGPIVTSPITNFVHLRSLANYCFTPYAQNENTINISFNELLFTKFSFVNTEFHDFKFNKTTFKECNFENARFTGKICFSHMNLDNKTAETFFAALENSFLNATINLTLKGKHQIILENDILTIPRLRRYIKPLINENKLVFFK